MNILNLILGLFSGLAKIVIRVLEIVKEKRLIEQGKTLERAEQAIKEAENLREQQKILMEKRTKSDVIKSMEDGKF